MIKPELASVTLERQPLFRRPISESLENPGVLRRPVSEALGGAIVGPADDPVADAEVAELLARPVSQRAQTQIDRYLHEEKIDSARRSIKYGAAALTFSCVIGIVVFPLLPFLAAPGLFMIGQGIVKLRRLRRNPPQI